MTAAILIGVLLLFANKILFAIEGLMCKAVDLLYDTFEVFAGIQTITFDGDPEYLLNVFFDNPMISTLYWGMAVIGFALTFAFALAAVIRKVFDSTGEKVKATYSQILTNVFKSILLIVLMTGIVSATIQSTSLLLRQMDELFDSAEELADPGTIVFNDTQRGTMYRILSTVGNYALNPSFNNRYNINSCYNEISADLQLLADDRVFAYTYKGGDAEQSWQYSLRQIYVAGSGAENIPLDIYNEQITNAILECSERIKTSALFVPLDSYTRAEEYETKQPTLGRIVMVCGSMRCARNGQYNAKASVDDALRAPYYYGEKDIYDYDEVDENFNISLFGWDHLVIAVVAYGLIKELVRLLINVIARIFNIILLYITAPGFIAVMPLDDGGKFKQWLTAFIIQTLSIFGSFIAVRLMVVFIPIVMQGQLVLFSETYKNALAKLVVVVGIVFTAEKASGMISGILADNAGYQSIAAGDVGAGLASEGMSIAGKAIGGAAKLGFKAGTKVLGGIGTVTGLGTLADSAGDKLKNLGTSMREKGGIIGAAKGGWTTKKEDQERQDKLRKKAEKKEDKNYKNAVLQNLKNLQPNGSMAPPPPPPGSPTAPGSPQGAPNQTIQPGSPTAPQSPQQNNNPEQTNNESTVSKAGIPPT